MTKVTDDSTSRGGEQMVCEHCGTAISPATVRFYIRGTGRLLQLCEECCAKEESVTCHYCGEVLPMGTLPYLHTTGLPVPLTVRLCAKCWRATQATISTEAFDNEPTENGELQIA